MTAWDTRALREMNDVDRGWVVGIIEGEGCFVPYRSSYGTVRMGVVVSMTDEDVIRRLEAVTGVGHVRSKGTRKAREHHLDQWSWSVTKGSQVWALVDVIYPLMGARRQARIEELRAECVASRTAR